jgi:hypothetical protein
MQIITKSIRQEEEHQRISSGSSSFENQLHSALRMLRNQSGDVE